MSITCRHRFNHVSLLTVHVADDFGDGSFSRTIIISYFNARPDVVGEYEAFLARLFDSAITGFRFQALPVLGQVVRIGLVLDEIAAVVATPAPS
jgi:hypothetical protein